ncbi:MAG: SpoIIE family protein phosphatase [Candidatus Acidiferrales bacterium]
MVTTSMSIDTDKQVILLVDDTPANIHIAQAILRDEFKVRVATSGAKALELVKAEPMPALILLDIEMPGMDGYEVCNHLKADPQTRDIPVIFLTAKTESEDETKGFEVGAVDYVHKPFSPMVVKARVRTHLTLRATSQQLAQQLLAINNELEMARQIQLAILPRETPKIRGLDIAARYLPMSSVAGDFYDFIIVDEQHVGILIADVSGHGLPAALIASMLQVALAAQLGHASEPGRVLSGLNRALCGKFQNHFVTAAYVFVDMEKESISYAGAGHPPLLLWRASTRTASEVVQNGLLLGHFPEETYAALQLPVGPGDKAVLYTDGILEASNPLGEMFGEDRFKHWLESNHLPGAERLADSVLDELSRWSGHPRGEGQQDDITLLSIEFRGQG